MSIELSYLTHTLLLTALLWVPYILNLIAVRGLSDAMGYPESPAPMAAWAQRLKAAHYNAVENLVVFAPLILIVEIMGLNSAATAGSAAVYFFARLVHAVSYAAAIPYLRTGAFAVSWFKEPLNNYGTALAFRRGRCRGALPPACVGLSRRGNEDRVLA